MVCNSKARREMTVRKPADDGTAAPFDIDRRQAARHELQNPLPVRDAISGETVGELADLSEVGMLLLTTRTFADGMLLQLTFSLPGAGGASHPIEVGVQQQWLQAGSNRNWVGLGIIDISTADAVVLREWLDRRH